MTDPIKAVCSRAHYPADKSSGTRRIEEIRLIVIHCTEGGTAEGVARYFQTEASGGSTHLVVDDKECQRCLSDATVPWGATGANRNGFHIEQCGYAKWTRIEWRQHDKTIRRAAYKTALHCKRFGIPVRWCHEADLKRNRKGITTHAIVSKAFPGSGHWDPGKGWPQDLFMQWVREYYEEL